jgi:hypothetical protein
MIDQRLRETPAVPMLSRVLRSIRTCGFAILLIHTLLLFVVPITTSLASPKADSRLFTNIIISPEIYADLRRVNPFLDPVTVKSASSIRIERFSDKDQLHHVILIHADWTWDYALYVFTGTEHTYFGKLSLGVQKYQPPAVKFLHFGARTYLELTSLAESGTGVLRYMTDYYSFTHGKLQDELTLPESGDLFVGSATPIEYEFKSTRTMTNNDLTIHYKIDFYFFDAYKTPVKLQGEYLFSDSFDVQAVTGGIIRGELRPGSKPFLLLNLLMNYDFSSFDKLHHDQIQQLIHSGKVSPQWEDDYRDSIRPQNNQDSNPR